MARIFIDGFESGNFDLWDAQANNTLDSTKVGRQGTYCCYLANGGVLRKNITAISEIYLAFKFSSTNVQNQSGFVQFYDASNNILGKLRGTAGGLVLTVTSNADSILANATVAISPYAWYLLEAYFKPNTSGGRWIVKQNGVVVIDYTGSTGLTANIASFEIVGMNLSYPYIDDVVADDANWIGNTTIQKIALSGGGSTTQWDASSGSNYACVDEIPGSDSDYVSTNVSGEIDTYQCADLTGNINSVKSVQVQARAEKNGASGPSQLYLIARPGSTDRLSSVKTVNSFAPKSLSSIWQTNPDTSNSWVSGEVNSLEIGIKAVG